MLSEHIINEFVGHQDVLSLLAFTSGYKWSQYSLSLSNFSLYSSIKYLFFHDWALCIFPNHLLLALISQKNLVIFCFLLFSASVTLYILFPLPGMLPLISLACLVNVYLFNKIQLRSLFCEVFLNNQSPHITPTYISRDSSLCATFVFLWQLHLHMS